MDNQEREPLTPGPDVELTAEEQRISEAIARDLPLEVRNALAELAEAWANTGAPDMLVSLGRGPVVDGVRVINMEITLRAQPPHQVVTIDVSPN